MDYFNSFLSIFEDYRKPHCKTNKYRTKERIETMRDDLQWLWDDKLTAEEKVILRGMIY